MEAGSDIACKDLCIADDERLVTPWGVAVEPSGSILAVDRVTQRLRRGLARQQLDAAAAAYKNTEYYEALYGALVEREPVAASALANFQGDPSASLGMTKRWGVEIRFEGFKAAEEDARDSGCRRR